MLHPFASPSSCFCSILLHLLHPHGYLIECSYNFLSPHCHSCTPNAPAVSSFHRIGNCLSIFIFRSNFFLLLLLQIHLQAIRNLCRNGFSPLRTVHISYVPDEEIDGFDGAAKFIKSKEFEGLNVGFVVDEWQASTGDDFWVFYADRSPWGLIIKAQGMPGHGSRMFDNSAVENLMKTVEMVTRFRDAQFDEVKASKAANSEVISVNPVYFKAGIPSPTGFVMNMQPSEAEAGFDLRLPPTVDLDIMKKRIAEEWAPATRNLTFQVVWKSKVVTTSSNCQSGFPISQLSEH